VTAVEGSLEALQLK